MSKCEIDELKVQLASSERLREDERLTWDAQHKRQASMNAHLAALVTDAQEELRKCQQDAIEIQADNERLRGLLGTILQLSYGIPSYLRDEARAALGTQADQPTESAKCNCDDREAKYCVNRISRTEPCKCKCHGANAIAMP